MGNGRGKKRAGSWLDCAISVLLKRYGFVTIPVFLLSLLATIVLYAKYTKQLHESSESKFQDTHSQGHPAYDAVIVPGGGLGKDGKPHTFVQARLEKAWEFRHNTKYFILLSRGTTHASRLDRYGFPIDECKADAQFLYSLGDFDRKKLLLECWSLDTIGNAVATRFLHTEPANLKKLLIITNHFHIDRVKSIFNHIFSLPETKNTGDVGVGGGIVSFFRSKPKSNSGYFLQYLAVKNKGMSFQEISKRNERERQSLRTFEKRKMVELRSIKEVHEFMMISHKAYAFQTEQELSATRQSSTSISKDVLNTY